MHLAAQMVQFVTAGYLSTGDVRELWSSIHSVELCANRALVHPIYPLRDCPTCGDLPLPEWAGLRVHCSSLTGIVQKMEATPSPTAGAYRALGTWVSPLPESGKRPLLERQDSYGRGMTREQAELSCIGEALERYSVIYRGNERLERARMNEIEGIDPREILLYSDQQYRAREEWNREADERYFVGEMFDPDEAIEWLQAVDLVDHAKAFAPAACSLMWYQFKEGEPEFARADTIGCGSGWTWTDALAHALFEWVERDAMAIWWYNQIPRPAIDIASLETPELLKICEDLRRIDRDLILLDCTTDIGIPTYVSVAARSDGTEPLFAGAAHLSPRIAALKAATEVGQVWFASMHTKNIDVEISRWFANLAATPEYLRATRAIEAPPEPSPMSAEEQIRFVVHRLLMAGLHPYAVDLSRSDVILKTARAIVPGLRHIWNRRAPGRLYDVPVRLGWLDRSLEEDELNSTCCMI